MEARAGIEPANRGFAVPGLTTWLPRRAPKHLLSIDFAPLEQAKSLLLLTTYEIFNSFFTFPFTLWFHARTEPTECYHCHGRRYGLVRHRLLW